MEHLANNVTMLVRYDVTEQQIAELRTQFAGYTFETPAKYEQGRRAIATLRDLRVAVEKKRVALKAGALAYGRKVDSVAEQLTVAIEAIEQPLKALKTAVDEETARAKAEAEAAQRAAAEAAAKVARDAEEDRLRAAREAEEQRLAAERAQLDAQRAELAELKRQRDAERAQLDQERRAIEAEKALQERLEFERLTTVRLEREAREQAERDRLAAEEARVAETERQAELARRLEALKPDAEKLKAFAADINTLTPPDVHSDEARRMLGNTLSILAGVVTALEGFGGAGEVAA